MRFLGSPDKTKSSDQVRAVQIGATRPEAMRTTVYKFNHDEQRISFLYVAFRLFILLPRSWVNCFIINVLLKLRPHTSMCMHNEQLRLCFHAPVRHSDGVALDIHL